jgi:predicted nucleic acid-binding protein
VALTHLVDTSVLKRLANPQIREVIQPLAEAGNLAQPTICDLEIGFSARNATEWDRFISAFEIIETTSNHVNQALQTQRLLAQRNQRGRKIPDLLIAAAAEANNLTLLHYDADFDLIRAVTGQSCHWIVQPGTID